MREDRPAGVLARWKKTTLLPLPLRSSPMQGWVDAIPHIKTKYSMLLHNDGYALDSFFGCELLQSLKHHQATNPDGGYVLAAPMLYESKADGSLAAHATQTNLRLVKDDSAWGATVHHDHSLRRALNRGFDFKEGDQTEFVEDHGFLIETDKIATIIDPAASFTLEYLDMIMTIRANKWKALFVPTARLEFRITEFSWRDIPYFMYKRSEATAHGTRDYLMAKWQANFPNTGFWTYIKYTIVEQHVYGGRAPAAGAAAPRPARALRRPLHPRVEGPGAPRLRLLPDGGLQPVRPRRQKGRQGAVRLSRRAVEARPRVDAAQGRPADRADARARAQADHHHAAVVRQAPRRDPAVRARTRASRPRPEHEWINCPSRLTW